MFHESRHLVGSIHARYVVHFNILKNSSSIVSYRPFFEAKAGAKIKPFSLHFQIFFKVFFNFFSKCSNLPFFSTFLSALSLESGCKDKRTCLHYPNFFTIIFQLFHKQLEGSTLKRIYPRNPRGILDEIRV